MSNQKRVSDFPIEPLLLNRHSSRAFSEQAVSDDELNILFEAARWAPSSFNEQPWRYVYAKQGDAQWQNFYELLLPANQVWACRAAVLIVVLSCKNLAKNNQFSPSHSFDTGAATQNMALQGCAMGLMVHCIGGFNHARARDLLNVPDDYATEVMVAVGRPGNADDLPENLRAREVLSGRKSLKDIVSRGFFLK